MTASGKYMVVLAWLLTLAGGAPQALAHGLGWQQDFNPTITLNFVFADGEPLAYGEVSVFPPDDQEFEYQKARTDQNGFFSFRPNQSGVWRFSGVDGQGHKTSGQITVTEEQLNPSIPQVVVQADEVPRSSTGPDVKSIVLGLSIICNVALLALWRRRGPQDST